MSPFHKLVAGKNKRQTKAKGAAETRPGSLPWRREAQLSSAADGQIWPSRLVYALLKIDLIQKQSGAQRRHLLCFLGQIITNIVSTARTARKAAESDHSTQCGTTANSLGRAATTHQDNLRAFKPQALLIYPALDCEAQTCRKERERERAGKCCDHRLGGSTRTHTESLTLNK